MMKSMESMSKMYTRHHDRNTSSAIMIEEFIRCGIKFASFGTNDLVQYTLAIDRNNEMLPTCTSPAPRCTSPHPQCNPGMQEFNIECSICGRPGPTRRWPRGSSNMAYQVSRQILMRLPRSECSCRTEKRIILEAARTRDAE